MDVVYGMLCKLPIIYTEVEWRGGGLLEFSQFYGHYWTISVYN